MLEWAGVSATLCSVHGLAMETFRIPVAVGDFVPLYSSLSVHETYCHLSPSHWL